MDTIIRLDENTANKIAAGEVIERPASVVKELVENSIDAGATSIDISVTRGGLEEILVVDDGSGMSTADARLCLERHATSKIRSAEDLFSVATMGFRGEALPSIASVSRLRLTTRRAADLSGALIEIHGGKVVNESDAGVPVGTQIQVKDLFFNTPARLKFIKSEGAETARITDTVQRLALARPDVSFRLTVNERPHLFTAGNNRLADVVHQIYGRQNSGLFLPLQWQGHLLSLNGLISRPSLARANRNMQSFFVNQRHVKSPLLADALQTAYSTLLPRNRFPAAVIFLTIDSGEVDVNVHPAKREVRFSRERDVYRQFLSGIKSALQENSLLGQLPMPGHSSFREISKPVYMMDNLFRGNQAREQIPSNTESLYAISREEQPQTEENVPDMAQTETTEHTEQLPEMTYIGRARSGYVIAENTAGELFIVDPHAAHERILYDLLYADLEAQDQLPAQEVIPQKMEFDPLTAAVMTKNLKKFAQIGLTFEPFGNNTFILRTTPVFFRRSLNQDDIRDIVDASDNLNNTPNALSELLKTMACKAAVKVTQDLSREEVNTLLKNLASAVNPSTCPHGRPTVLAIARGQLDTFFRRR